MDQPTVLDGTSNEINETTPEIVNPQITNQNESIQTEQSTQPIEIPIEIPVEIPIEKPIKQAIEQPLEKPSDESIESSRLILEKKFKNQLQPSITMKKAISKN